MTPSRATVPLILMTLALSLAGVALIVNGALSTPSADVIATLCAQAVTAATPASCPETKTTDTPTNVITVGPAVDHPGFSYPLGWNAVKSSAAGTTTITLAGGGLYDPACTNCTNATLVTLTTEPYTLAAGQTLDSYVQALFATNTSVVIRKDDVVGGSLYTVNGNALAEPFEPFTYLLFFGKTMEAGVYLPESDLLPVGVAERAAFISSLDFSLIP